MTTNVMTQMHSFLLVSTLLGNLVGENIWAKQDPPPGYKPVADGPGVVFNTRGGRDNYSGCMLLPSIQYRCIGATEEQAWDVYLALLSTLQNASSAAHKLRGSRIQAQGQLIRRVAPPWPQIFCAFVHYFVIE